MDFNHLLVCDVVQKLLGLSPTLGLSLFSYLVSHFFLHLITPHTYHYSLSTNFVSFYNVNCDVIWCFILSLFPATGQSPLKPWHWTFQALTLNIYRLSPNHTSRFKNSVRKCGCPFAQDNLNAEVVRLDNQKNYSQKPLFLKMFIL